jgi:hypothetical protein
MKKTKRCESCNVQFESNQPTAKYCSNACKCQAYIKRRIAGQTNISISGVHSSNDSNQLNDLKAYVHSLEKQMEYLMQDYKSMNDMVKKTMTEIAERYREELQRQDQYYRAELNHLNQVKSNSQNKLQDEENTQRIIGSILNTFNKK